jgi:hypothetical protein
VTVRSRPVDLPAILPASRSSKRGRQVPRRRRVERIEAARIERLARALTPDLIGRQVVLAQTADVADVGEWRAAARKAARDLGVSCGPAPFGGPDGRWPT